MTFVNIRIPDELHKKLKIEASKSEKTLKDLVIEILKNRGGKL